MLQDDLLQRQRDATERLKQAVRVGLLKPDEVHMLRVELFCVLEKEN